MIAPYYGLALEEYAFAYGCGRSYALCRPSSEKAYDHLPEGRMGLIATREKLMQDLARGHTLAASHAAYLDGYQSVLESEVSL